MNKKNETYKKGMTFKEKMLAKLVLDLGAKTEKKRKLNDGKNQKVAIIKQDGIGDFILFIPAFEKLKELYKGKKIILFCSSVTEEVAKESGLFDEVRVVDKREFTYFKLRRTHKKYSKEKFDILLHPTQPRTVESEILAHFIDAKEKIASLGECGSLPQTVKTKFDTFYDRLIDTGEDNMTMIQSATFVRSLGASDFLYTMPKIRKVENHAIDLPEKFFAIFLGGSVYNKLWPAENYFEVAKQVKEKTGFDCVLLGSKGDLDQARDFASAGEIDCINLIGKTTISQLFFVISKAKIIIGNDTCSTHIANALGVPSVTVRGQFSDNKFYPYVVEKEEVGDIYPVDVKAEVKCKGCTKRGGGYFCIRGDYYAKKKVKCLMRVGVKEVIDAVDGVLEKNNLLKNAD